MRGHRITPKTFWSFVVFVAELRSILASVAIIDTSSRVAKGHLILDVIGDVFSHRNVSIIHSGSFPSISASESLGVEGFIELRKCLLGSQGSGTSGTPSPVLPLLVLRVEGCPQQRPELEHDAAPDDVPVFMANEYRKHSCLSYIVGKWLTEKLQRIPSFKHRKSSENFRSLFLDCVGELFMSDDIQMRQMDSRGKKYLNGRKLLIVTIHRPPFLIFTLGGETGDEIVSWKGFCIDMLDDLAGRFNFTYKLILPPDGNWGAPTPNGTFNGMVGMVQRHEVEFAIASITITHIREQVIDFPHRFYEDPTTILIPPPVDKENVFAFLSPFQAVTWFYICLGILICAFLMWVLSNYPKGLRGFLYPHNDPKFRHSPHTHFFRYLSAILFILAAQSTKTKQTDSSRVLLGFWWAFGLIFMFSYTGTLISFLTFPNTKYFIESLEELSNQREILWTYRANTAYDHLFGKAEPPGTYYKIGLLLTERPDLRVATDQEGVNAVLTKNMAYIKEKSWLDFAMEEDFLKTGECRLAQVPQTFFSAGFGWALQEGSPYLMLFNDVFLRMRQTGLFQYWQKRYWPKPNKCTAGRGFKARAPRALTLVDLSGHFLILGAGMVSAFLLFIIELMVHKLF